MSDQTENKTTETKGGGTNATSPPDQAPKQSLSLSKLTSRFADSRRETPQIPGPTYAEQMQIEPRSVAAITDVASAITRNPANRDSIRPFSELRKLDLDRRIQVQLPLPVGIALRSHAIATGRSTNHIIDIAIWDYFQKHGIKI